MKIAISLICLFVVGIVVAANNPDSPDDEPVKMDKHVELGAVNWNRDFEKAKQISRSTGKPLFVLFQEIPGCQTCQDFGNRPMSYPLLVEAIEDLFVPVAIFNNREGTDAQILKKFDEPSWNNPVVRYLNSDESDIISRTDRIWSTDATIDRMIAALTKAGQNVPDYLRYSRTSTVPNSEIAEFAMHCYWEGEAKLGSIKGVHSTRSGWRDGLEVVQLTYSPKTVDYKTLLQTAQSFDCASKVFAHNDDQYRLAQEQVGDKAAKAVGKMRVAKESDQKYYLAHSLYKHLPLTELQATKINSLVKQNSPADQILSPRQKTLLKSIQAVARADKDSLASFTYPDDARSLGDYQSKLWDHLKKADSIR